MNKSGVGVALGIGLGYLLGRSRKMRLALMLAGAGAAGGAGKLPGLVMERATGAVPGLGKLPGGLQSKLLDAGKAAAMAAATSKVDSLTEKLRDQTESLRGGGGSDEDGDVGRRSKARTKARRAKEPADHVDDEYLEDEDDDLDDEADLDDEPEPTARRGGSSRGQRPAGAGHARRNSPGRATSKTAPQGGRTAERAGGGRSPVRRSGR